jgi:copper resistance protein D
MTYLTLVVIHVLAAMVWIGGMTFLSVAGAPVLRRVEPESLRTQLFEALGLRFRYLGWTAVALLLATGLWMLSLRGWLTWQVLGRRAFWGTPAGTAFAWKLSAVAVMIVLSAVHDVAFSPGRVRALEALPGWPRRRRWLVLSARAAAVAAIVVVIAAVKLVRS